MRPSGVHLNCIGLGIKGTEPWGGCAGPLDAWRILAEPGNSGHLAVLASYAYGSLQSASTELAARTE